MGCYVGLDIGGTKFMVAAADEDGNILSRTLEQTPLDLEEGLQLIHKMIEQVVNGEEIEGMVQPSVGP